MIISFLLYLNLGIVNSQKNLPIVLDKVILIKHSLVLSQKKRKKKAYQLSFLSTVTTGLAEHGSSYNILLIYEHNLARSAYNFILGPFGQVKGFNSLITAFSIFQ